MTMNINQKTKKSKQEQINLALSRKQKRSKVYKDLKLLGEDPSQIYQKLFDFKSRGKKTAYEIINIFLQMRSHKLDIFPSTSYLAKRIGVHEKHISRVTATLEALGLIKKYWRGFKKSRRYKLSCAFHNPIVQFVIHGLFPFMKAKAAQFFRNTNKFIESEINPFYPLFSLDVTHNKQCTYIKINYKEEKELYYSKKRDETQPVGNNFKDLGSLLKKFIVPPQKFC